MQSHEESKRRAGGYARAIVRCRRAAGAAERARAAGRDLPPCRLAAWARCYDAVLSVPVRTAADLLALGDAAMVFLEPSLDGGVGDGSIDAESATIVRLIEGQRAVLAGD